MVHPDLVSHNEQTRKDIIELAPGIWTAVGYAASNVHMIEGRQSLTIVDTSESTKAAQNILSEFRKLSDKPIGRIIYTHSHRDHISGASKFHDAGVPIYASYLFKSDLVDVDPNQIAPNIALGRRTQAQFGIGLTPNERVSLGCGPGDRPMEGLGQGFISPTDLISQDINIDLDGIPAKLMHAPGETDDHLVVWLPEQRILFSGDNWYHAFPNLYAIRGTPYRDFATWAETLGTLADMKAHVLAPGHTRPVFGHDKIQEVLLSTRAAILHVMTETATGMDQGRSPEDIAATITLPENLAEKPWLRELYGKLSWSVLAFASGTLGWYNGNPTNLGILTSTSKAAHMAELAGGDGALMIAAEKTDDLQWRLELCDHLIALGKPVQNLKADTLCKLADDEINATARNTYLWEAKIMRQEAAER